MVNIVVMSMVLLLPAISVSAEDYEIRLHRPQTAGATYRMTVTGSDNSEMGMDINSKPEKRETENLTVDFESTVTILEVSGKGSPVKESHRIVRCNRIVNGSRTALVPPGSVVLASWSAEKIRFTIEGKEVSPEAEEVLYLAISLDDSDSTADDAFGATGRKKVGESWPINADVAVKELRSPELDIAKESISGKVTLESVGSKDNIPCLTISGKAVISRLDFPIDPEIYTDRAQGRISFTSKYPLDPAMGMLEETSNFSIEAVLKSKPDRDTPDITVYVVKEQAMTKQFKY
jgi:hypothetical protein